MSTQLNSEEVKYFCREQGADLVGIGPVGRFKNAPLRMSPQGHLPTAKSVIVSAIHIPDACLELGGEPVPQNWGTGFAGGSVNNRLERLGFALAKFLENRGYKSIPIPQTIVWRYRPFKELDISFSPDLSHIHAAAAAGLGEIGYHGILMTPEYGDRQRFVTVITEAPLKPDPMYNGPPLCDKCMECVKHCATSNGLRKEVEGLTKVEIGGKTFKYANKNKWRCAWAERFQLSYNLPIPEKVDNKVIVPLLADKREGWVSACEPCWCYCVPPYLRQFSPLRKRPMRKSFWMAREIVDERTGQRLNLAGKELSQQIKDIAFKHGVDLFGIVSIDEFSRLKVKPELMHTFSFRPFKPEWGKISTNPKDFLPEAVSVVALGISYPQGCDNCIDHMVSGVLHKKLIDARNDYSKGIDYYKDYDNHFDPVVSGVIREKLVDARIDILRHITDRGFSAVSFTYFADNYGVVTCGLGKLDEKTGEVITPEYGKRQRFTGCIITSAPLIPTDKKRVDALPSIIRNKPKRNHLTERVKVLALQQGADLVGIATVERFEGIKMELRKLYNEEQLGLSVVDENQYLGGYAIEPKVTYKSEVLKSPLDYMLEAKSVIVLGVSYPFGIIDRAEKPPAEAVGPYSMYVHDCAFDIAAEIAFFVAKMLSNEGYQSVPVGDLCKTASKVAHPFYQVTDCTASRYAAVLAGLGEMGWSGNVITPEFGLRQRFFSIITDADLESTHLYDGEPLCKKCFKCVEACPVGAISKEGISITLSGKTWEQGKVDRLRCDWAKRYGFIADAGPKYLGCQHNITPPDKITSDAIIKAMKQMDPLQKRILCIAESCILCCPHARDGAAFTEGFEGRKEKRRNM